MLTAVGTKTGNFTFIFTFNGYTETFLNFIAILSNPFHLV